MTSVNAWTKGGMPNGQAGEQRCSDPTLPPAKSSFFATDYNRLTLAVQTMESINQTFEVERLLPQYLSKHPDVRILEDEEAITALKDRVAVELRRSVLLPGNTPLYDQVDGILERMAGPILLTTGALRRFFVIASQEFVSTLIVVVRELLASRQSTESPVRHAMSTENPVEQVWKLMSRFRARTICINDFLELPEAAQHFLHCLEQKIDCKEDARSLLQMHLLTGCQAVELAEYFPSRKEETIKQLLRASRKKLWRAALTAAKGLGPDHS